MTMIKESKLGNLTPKKGNSTVAQIHLISISFYFIRTTKKLLFISQQHQYKFNPTKQPFISTSVFEIDTTPGIHQPQEF